MRDTLNSYGKLSTQFFDLDKPQPPASALAFYLSQSQLTGGPILEPMCGSGRFLIPLMQAGYQVAGIDASPEMLTACLKKCQVFGLTPCLYQQFLHELDLPGSFPLVMTPAGSFGLITDLSEAQESLLRIFHRLSAGGRLIVEIDQMPKEPDSNLEDGERIITRQDGTQIKLISSGVFDPTECIYHGTNRYEHLEHGHILE